jgi:hypothetical protein
MRPVLIVHTPTPLFTPGWVKQTKLARDNRRIACLCCQQRAPRVVLKRVLCLFSPMAASVPTIPRPKPRFDHLMLVR